MKKKIIALIPARLNSSRLKRKLLLPIHNIPLIIHVYKRVLLSKLVDDAIICCDDQKILEVAKKFKAKVLLTSKIHKNGTERIFEVFKKLKNKNYQFIIDVQGDEPLINPTHIDKVIKFHKKNLDADIVVPSLLINNYKKHNENIVKIVSTKSKKILFFSRSNIPFFFKKKKRKLQKHLSIVSFKPFALKKFCMSKMTINERIENIELMRALELGLQLKTFVLQGSSFSVDVKKDYLKAKKYMKNDNFFKLYR